MATGNDRSNAKSLTAAEKQAQAVMLRRAGAEYSAIATQLGIARSTAHSYVKRYIESVKQEAREVAEDIVHLELERLDAMFMSFYPRACKGDKEAFECCVKAMRMRADYLGLFAPKKVEHSGTVMSVTEMDREIEQLLAELATGTEAPALDAPTGPNGGTAS